MMMMMMMMSLLPQSSWSVPLLPKSKPFNGDFRPVSVPVNYRGMRTSAGVPDFFSADWLESRRKRPDGPRLNFSAEEAVEYQLDALKHNDQPREDYEIEVYVQGFDPFANWPGFDPYSWPASITSLECLVLQNQFKQRVWVRGNHTKEEGIFQFTMVQRIGGLLDGYWLTESVLHDGDVFDGGLAY